jgi:hypothetical protein
MEAPTRGAIKRLSGDLTGQGIRATVFRKESPVKKAAIILAVLLAALPLAAQEAPTQINAGVAMEIPGFSLGPMVEFITFPMSIKIGQGMYNYLGYGGAAGLYLVFDPSFGVAIPIQGVFAGRFGFIKNLPIDWDVRMGVMIGGARTLFLGSTSILVQFPLSSYTARASGGINFFPGSGGKIYVSFVLGFDLVFPLKGFKQFLSI